MTLCQGCTDANLAVKLGLKTYADQLHTNCQFFGREDCDCDHAKGST